ncbi:hypothetical protein Bbelb_253480 [Branchiostoma belcheri]|nr:hypothetical protein Bbelb_253480 [Branchiostoma belcheri]
MLMGANGTVSQQDRHRKQFRRLAGYFNPHHISNTKLYKICNSSPLQNEVLRRRWTLFGHILRMPHDSPAQKALNIALTSKPSTLRCLLLLVAISSRCRWH